MKILNFRTKLSDDDKEDFQREIIQVNQYRSRNFSILLIFIVFIVLMLTDKANLQSGFSTVGIGYKRLFYLHLILGASMLVFLGAMWLKQQFPSTKVTWVDKAFDMSFCLIIALICALFSVNDQLINGEITLYVLGIFVVAIINYLNPLTSLLIYLSSYIVFILGITKYQTNKVALQGHYGNSAILIIVAWFMSSILYYAKAKEFSDRKTIDRQKTLLEEANNELTEINEALRQSLVALDESQNMIFTLALALESKDEYTRGHSERVAEYAVALAEHLGLKEEEKKSLWRAAILHDTGKIGIPDAILNKPSRLSEEEWQIMKSHPERGELICSKLQFAQEILPIIRHHHERFDGTGYPDGLKGVNIPFLARIVAIADMVDAVTSHRPYRTDQSLAIALEELQRHSGTQFDPELAEAFVELYKNKTLEGN